jgi:hypothetical protein
MSPTVTMVVVDVLLAIAGAGLVLLIALVGMLAVRDVARAGSREDWQREPRDFWPEEDYEVSSRSSSATAASESRLPV